VRNAVNAVQAEHVSSSCGYRGGFEQTHAVGSIAAIPRRLFKTPLSASSFAVRQGPYQHVNASS
jgi:hypothetical protein